MSSKIFITFCEIFSLGAIRFSTRTHKRSYFRPTQPPCTHKLWRHYLKTKTVPSKHLAAGAPVLACSATYRLCGINVFVFQIKWPQHFCCLWFWLSLEQVSNEWWRVSCQQVSNERWRVSCKQVSNEWWRVSCQQVCVFGDVVRITLSLYATPHVSCYTHPRSCPWPFRSCYVSTTLPRDLFAAVTHPRPCPWPCAVSAHGCTQLTASTTATYFDSHSGYDGTTLYNQ